MKIIDPGHVYELAWVDGHPGFGMDRRNLLVFVKREGEKYPGNVGHHPGTQVQEVLRALIDRLKYVDAQDPHRFNSVVLDSLRNSIYLLETRAAEKRGRHLPIGLLVRRIEDAPTCGKCGHVGCEGACR